MEEFIELCSRGSPLTSQERRVRVLSLLESGQLNPQQRHGDGGWYPLHNAARFGRGDVVQLLISSGRCDPQLTTREGHYTALHVACKYNQTEVVEALCEHVLDGTPAVKDRAGNTPLHIAGRNGHIETVRRLARKYSERSVREVNRAGSTPLGLAVREGHSSIARFFMAQDQAVGNPASIFPDFRDMFPSFKHRQSLDHPVSVFVMGNRKTGKSSLIKSIQIEGVINRAIGAFWPTAAVEYHSGGVVCSDVSSYGYGRVKFYELSSCRQSTQENIFSTFAKNGRAIFIITISFRDEMSEMEAKLLYWLSFIHHQFRSSTTPYIAVVGSFLYYTKLGSLRLDNRHRMHLVYHRVLATHQELCGNFHFLGKYSIDCRHSESPGMTKLRKILHRNCRELRPRGGEGTIPSSCYVLLSALREMRPGDSDPPVVRVSEIEQMAAQHSSSESVSLFSLLLTTADNPQPNLTIRSLLDKLEERKAVLVLHHLDSEDPWVIYDELKLITQIDKALIKRAMRLSTAGYLNPAIMSDDKLISCLSPLSNTLNRDVLFNLLHYFMIMEVMARGNDTEYFLPSVLSISRTAADDLPLHWRANDTNYTLGFAQCIIPQSDQVVPVFMPRFLYFLLYEIFESIDDCDTVVVSHSSLYYDIPELLQVYITISSSAIIVNMRCTESGVFSCLKIRNNLDTTIHQRRELLQPNVKVSQYIVPMESITLPIMKTKHIGTHGIELNELKCFLTKGAATPPTAYCMLKLRSFEPYEWLSRLQKVHRDSLLDHRLTNVHVGKSFIRDLAKCVGDKWELLLQFSVELQGCDTSPPNTEDSSGPEGSAESSEPPTYHTLLELFSSMSIFHTDLASALKNPELVGAPSTQAVSEDESQSDPQYSVPPLPDEHSSASDNPPSTSSSSNIHRPVIYYSGQDLSQPSLVDGVTLKTCSTSSDTSSTASTNLSSSVPNMRVTQSHFPASNFPQYIHFVSQPQVLKCVSAGGTHQDKLHGISFTVPPQAVRDGNEMEIEYAVAAVGPFTYPNNLTPVSPILWIRVKGQEKLRKPIRISIPHAVYVTQQNRSRLLHVLCAQDGEDSYCFARAHKVSTIQSECALLSTKLSKSQYLFCVAGVRCREVVSRTQYYLVKVAPIPTKNSFTYSWKLHFFVTYALPACIELVKSQFSGDHTVEERGFLFDTNQEGEDPLVSLEHTNITPEHWTITKEGYYRQIEASKVELGNKSSFEINCHMYPPNFTISVSGHQAVGNSSVKLCFRGTTLSELHYDIVLSLPRRHTSRGVSSSTMGDPENTSVTQRLEEDVDFSHHHSGRSSPQSTHSAQSAPPFTYTVLTRTRLSGDYGSTTPNNPFINHMNIEKKNAMEVLTSNYATICQQLTNRTIRRMLVEQRALTIDQGQTLMDCATVSESDANERLVQMIGKGGVNGFRQFMIALQKTSVDNQGHQDLLLRLVSELNHLRPHSQSATNILSSMPRH